MCHCLPQKKICNGWEPLYCAEEHLPFSTVEREKQRVSWKKKSREKREKKRKNGREANGMGEI